ncbi:MAG: hypothetical protein HYR85_18930 [Planctomycetes bacterium]|nr:hypothetical protein [Planctomycetota bacterium]
MSEATAMVDVPIDIEGTRCRAVDVIRDGLAWRVDADWRDVVVRDVIDRLPAIREGAALGTVVKQNLMRTVYRIAVEGAPGRCVYLKVHRVPTLIEKLKSLVRASRAETEWRMMTIFRESGLPTARPLAVAERRAGAVLRDAYFVTEGIADATDLVPYLNRAFPVRLRGGVRGAKRALLARLARLVRSMHERGIYYSDLHSGNILVTGDPPDEARIHFIDLHTGHRVSKLGVRRRLRNLARLSHSLLEATTRTDRLRFFLDYAAGDAVLGPALRSAFRRLEARVARLERRRLRSRALRCVMESSRFTRLRSDGLRGFAQRRFSAGVWREVITGHARALRGDVGRKFKDGRSTRVTGFETSAGECVCVKEYRCPSPLDRLKRALGYRKALRSWRAGNALLVRGIEVAEPLAFLRAAGPGGADLLVMRDVSDLSRLDHFVFERMAGTRNRERRRLEREMATFVADLHRRGAYHNDLKACNVLVAGTDAARRFLLIDFDGARTVRGGVSVRRRIKNLAQLSASIPTFVSLSERFRFLRDYSQGRMSRAERRRYYVGVIRACRRKTTVGERPIE